MDKGWPGKKNGELIKLMISEGFDALLTFDKNIQYQQNLNKYLLPILVLNASDNSYSIISKLALKIKITLDTNIVSGVAEMKLSLVLSPT